MAVFSLFMGGNLNDPKDFSTNRENGRRAE